MRKPPAYHTYLLYEGLLSFAFALAFTYSLVYWTTVAALDPLQLVLVGTALESSVFLFEIPTGIVADVYSRRLSVIIGVFLLGIGIWLMGSIPLFFPIIASQVLWGLGYTFTSGATQAWITDEIGEEAAGGAFLRGSQAEQLGALVGIPLSVLLATMRVNLPIQAGGILLLGLGLLLVFIMPEHGFTPTPPSERNTWTNMLTTFQTGLGMLRRRPALLTILAVGFFYGLYSEAFDRLWVKLLLDNFNLPALGRLGQVAWFGILEMVGLLLSALALEIVRRRLDTNTHRNIARTLLFITAILIVAIFSFAVTHSLWIVLLAYWAIYIIREVISPIYITWVNQRLDPAARATVISMSSQVDAIGQISGGPALGLVGNTYGVRTAIAAAAFLLSPVLVLFARTMDHKEAAPIIRDHLLPDSILGKEKQ